MKIYRIARKEYINDISGTGAKIYGGRWNAKGTSILYCSENVSLAILEILVHFDGLTVPHDLFLLTLEIPDEEVIDFSRTRFNRIRKAKNAEYKFKEEGEKWVASNKSLGMKVPSVITSNENNVLINPKHPNFSSLKKTKVVEMDLDERLFK